MNYLRKQFGPSFVKAALQCPTFLRDLESIRKHQAHIRRLRRKRYSYSIPARNTMYIGTGRGLASQLIDIAHEYVHVVKRISPNSAKFTGTRNAFIAISLDCEVSAIVHELKVTRELINAGYDVPRLRTRWLRIFDRGGRKAVLKALRKTYTSTLPPESYPDYYGNDFDDNNPFRGAA